MWAKLILPVLLAVAALTSPAAAQQAIYRPDYIMPAQDRGRGGGQVRPLREITDMLRGRYGGELVDARLEGGDRPIYLIRWRMPNNDLRDFVVDAVTGQIR
jgi:uncharacterized membrane protein YkoI